MVLRFYFSSNFSRVSICLACDMRLHTLACLLATEGSANKRFGIIFILWWGRLPSFWWIQCDRWFAIWGGWRIASARWWIDSFIAIISEDSRPFLPSLSLLALNLLIVDWVNLKEKLDPDANHYSTSLALRSKILMHRFPLPFWSCYHYWNKNWPTVPYSAPGYDHSES